MKKYSSESRLVWKLGRPWRSSDKSSSESGLVSRKPRAILIDRRGWGWSWKAKLEDSLLCWRSRTRAQKQMVCGQDSVLWYTVLWSISNSIKNLDALDRVMKNTYNDLELESRNPRAMPIDRGGRFWRERLGGSLVCSRCCGRARTHFLFIFLHDTLQINMDNIPSWLSPRQIDHAWDHDLSLNIELYAAAASSLDLQGLVKHVVCFVRKIIFLWWNDKA